MDHNNYLCAPSGSLVEAYKEDDQVLEINLDMVVEPVLCLCKQETNEVNENIHQGETCLRYIQCQGKMHSYTGTLSVIHAIIMYNYPNQWPDKTRKQLALQWLDL